MRFVKTDSTEAAASHTARLITEGLEQKKRVLWFISGGSAISVAIQARSKFTATKGLLVTLVDERYGPPGHPDSNWHKLMAAGFDTKGIYTFPVLDGRDFTQTAANFDQALVKLLDAAALKIGLFGIGSDGHTAGILPGSSAIDSKQLVSSYKGPDFERITITPKAIARLDYAIAYAMGADKARALKNLQKELPVTKQPAQVLKLAHETIIYNDQLEGDKS